MASLSDPAGLDPESDPAAPPNTSSTPAPNTSSTAARPATYQDIISAMATKQGIDPRLALAVAHTESGLNPAAKSPKGALGIMQLMPATAARLGVDPNDPIQNIQGGIAELKRLSDEHHGDVTMMLRRYNGSPDAPDAATDPYVRTVLGRLAGSSARTAAPPPTGKSASAAGAASVASPPPAAAAPPTADQAWDAAHPYLAGARDFGGAVKKAFNPYEQEGRRNLAGLAGATAAGFAAGGVGAVPAFGAAAGAALFSGAEVSAERAITGKGEPNDDLIEAGKQGATNLAGSAVMWPVQRAARGILASKVGSAAAESLSTARQATMDTLDAALDTAKTHARDVATAASRAIRAARGTAAEGVEAAKVGATASAEKVAAPYVASVASPPPTRAIGKQVGAVVAGPAKSTKEAIGQSVEEAAASGPAIPLENAKAKAQGIFDNQIKGLETYFSGKAAESGEGDALAGVGGQGAEILRSIMAKGVSEEQKAAITSQLVGAGLPQDVAEATVDAARHPAAGVLRRIINAPDEVPFAAAHQLKRQLGEAVDWEHPAKKQVQQITKGVFQSLRVDMAEHEPYNQATAAYAKVAPLFSKGYGKQIQQEALVEPGRFIGRISTKAPEQVKMLRELLVDLPAEQGDEAAAQGLKAWNGVRSAWTHDKLIKGGIEKIGEKIDALPPEFVQEFYGDAQGKTVLNNLKQIHTAYSDAVAAGKVAVEEAGAKGKALVESTRVAGENARNAESANLQQLRADRRLAQKPSAEETKFLQSSVVPKKASTPEELIMNALRAATLGPHSRWGALALAKLVQGPTASDLVEWAAYSPPATKALVAVFTSPAPGRAVANLYRLYTGNEAPSPVTPPPGGRFAGDGLSGGSQTGSARPGAEAATPIGQPPPRELR